MRKTSSQRGAALLLALLVLVILIALVGQMALTAAHHRALSRAALDDLQNGYGARAGYLKGRLLLQADRKRGGEVDSTQEMWARPFRFSIPPDDRCEVWVRIEDAAGKINLSALVDEGGKRVPEQVERLKRLFLICRQDPRMVEYIVDYVDADTRGDFEEGARNKRLLMPEELMRIRGLPRGILFGDPRERSRGILEFVTLWPVSGGKKINLNTAPAEVLASLDDEWGLELAQQVVSWRSGKKENGRPADFEKVSELEETLGMDEELFDRVSPFLTVKSGCFEIHTRSTSGTTEKAHLFVVTRGEEELELEASMARHDLFWVKPPEEEY